MQRGDDGKVVADLGVVKDAFAGLDITVVQRHQGVRRQVLHLAAGEHFKGLLDHRHIVFGQGARIGTRVGQRFVALVQALRNRQRGLGRKAELAVGFALQRGQIKQQAGSLRGRLGFFADAGFLAAHGVGNAARIGLGPDAVGLELGIRLGIVCIGSGFLPGRVKPLARILAGISGKAGVHFPVVAADKLAYFFFALNHHAQRRRLHAADSGQKETAVARVEGGHGAGAVDADHPVGLGAATRGVGQGQHLRVAAQAGKTVADSGRRHGLQPQALHRVFGFGILLNQPEDELTFAARITGINHGVHVFALGQLDDGIEPGLGLVNGLEVKVGRDDGQVGKAPFAALDVKFFRRLNLHQVADRRGDDPVITLEVLVVFFKLARRGRDGAHDVLGHRGLFRYHQSFHKKFFKPCTSSGNKLPDSAKTTFPSRPRTTTTGKPRGLGQTAATCVAMAAGNP